MTFCAHSPSRSDLMRSLIDQLNKVLELSDSPYHGSTSSELALAQLD